MKVSPSLALFLALISLTVTGCEMAKGESHEEEHHKVVVTSPEAKDVIITQPYVCRIFSKRHIEARALVDGYLEEILIKEGQAVKQGQVMFKILPILYKAKYEAEKAEAQVAEIELENTKKLYESKPPVVSIQDVKLHEAKLANAQARAALAKAELQFTEITAPFDGIVDRLLQREGSLIKERDILTTVSDNSVMWVYFNVSEAVYLEYMAHPGQDRRIELMLADGSKFQYASTGVTVEANFNIENGNIPFRADFPNPNRLLRHGQTGTVLIHRTLKNALVIPQRATFEILDRLYVWVVGKDDVAHQRLISKGNELEDIFVIKTGLDVNDRIIFEGVRQVHDGDKVEYELRSPKLVMANQKNHAE